MEKELEILKLADYSEHFELNGASAYLIVNKNIADHPCMFGFVTLPEDYDIAKELFSRIENKARELGYKDIVGPLNYTTWMSYRWAISNFETKLMPDCDNPPYYVDFIKQLGYRELYTYRSAAVKIENPLYHLSKKAYEAKLKEGFTFKLFRGKEAYSVAKEIYDISLDAFAGSYLYSEISFDYFERVYLEWTHKLDLTMYVAYNPEGEAIGFVMGYPTPDGKYFVSKTTGVRKAYQKHKIYTALLYLGSKYIAEQGFSEILYHFQCEQRSTFQRFAAPFESNEKRYAVFIKDLA